MPPEGKGVVEKGCPARPQGIWRPQRTEVRENGKAPRTPLATFFGSP